MRSIEKLIPAPWTSIALLALWLALSRRVGAGQLALGLALALLVPLLTARLHPSGVRARGPLAIARFIAIVAHDVVASAFQVGWGVVVSRWRPPRSRFVVIPLDLHDPLGLAALAMVTTVVPGTVWSELALDRSALLLHVWNVGDERRFVERFKSRYEQRLREIFE